jgi:pimeloyl-[acyl-carrier protein] methyl ester esterase
VSLHRTSLGAGPDVALLHGWGLHGGIFTDFAERLSSHFRVHAIDLPGHGRSAWSRGAGDLEGWSRLVAAHLPSRCAVIGWSLGGYVAQHMARIFPQQVSRLVLIATGAVGVKRRDFQAAADPVLLQTLARRLTTNWRAAVQDFLSVEVRGDDNPLAALRHLRQHLDSQAAPNPAALQAGLEILRCVDLRGSAKPIQCPTLLLAGERDRIVPPEGVRALNSLILEARCDVIEGAAHAPFLSHPDVVESSVKEFLR